MANLSQQIYFILIFFMSILTETNLVYKKKRRHISK